jgi:hypothetical protein
MNATPSAEPSWRAMVNTAAPDARSARDRLLAAANNVGWINAFATPHNTMLGRIATR